MLPRLSRHAIDEAVRRRISLALLETVLTAPDQVVQLAALLVVYQSRVTDETGKVYLIRAIVSNETAPGTVLTVYRTIKIDKYWRPSQ